MKNIALATCLGLVSASALAQTTPVGLWKTVDDSTQKEKSLVRIQEVKGVFSGRIEKLLDPDTKPGQAGSAVPLG